MNQSFTRPCKLQRSRWARLCGFTCLICCCGCFSRFIPSEKKTLIQSCLSKLWHGAWTCFFIPKYRLRHWEGNTLVCVCAGWRGWRGYFVPLPPQLQIFNNYLEDWGFYFKVLSSSVAQWGQPGPASRASSSGGICYLIFIGRWCLSWW